MNIADKTTQEQTGNCTSHIPGTCSPARTVTMQEVQACLEINEQVRKIFIEDVAEIVIPIK
ncbi:hypothetical protein [Bordetella sp. FB-8]|uniref:hypothetical protein n=1 Tax=Bordetella sp. FB-8 TaxID=1159870 RepID=UPI0003A3D5CD|nr:hypothetical protein [Bordetella sp. FB-8]